MNAPQPPSLDATLRSVEEYYSGRLRQFGATARGVDWNSEASQVLRFERLLEVVDPRRADVSLLDVGCGYGALLDFLQSRGTPVEYRGFDISAAMIAAARERHANSPRAVFTTDPAALGPATYVVASGIFNVKLHHTDEAWRTYVFDTIGLLHEASEEGFSFNMLSTYSDAARRRQTLFYGDPCEFFDHCKRRYSPRVALLHDYPLYEFTIIVRK